VDNEVADVEMLLEAYYMHIDAAFNRLQASAGLCRMMGSRAARRVACSRSVRVRVRQACMHACMHAEERLCQKRLPLREARIQREAGTNEQLHRPLV